MSCAQIKVTSSGSLQLPGGTSLPGKHYPIGPFVLMLNRNFSLGSYTDSTPGIQWNIYLGGGDPKQYKAPGPAVWSGSAGGSIGQVGNA
jgi:cellulase